MALSHHCSDCGVEVDGFCADHPSAIIESIVSGLACYVCHQAGDDVEATHAGCPHLGAHDHIPGIVWGLCDECHAAGPCPECEEQDARRCAFCNDEDEDMIDAAAQDDCA